MNHDEVLYRAVQFQDASGKVFTKLEQIKPRVPDQPTGLEQTTDDSSHPVDMPATGSYRNNARLYDALRRKGIDWTDEKVARISHAIMNPDQEPPNYEAIGRRMAYLLTPYRAPTDEEFDRMIETARLFREAEDHIRNEPKIERRGWAQGPLTEEEIRDANQGLTNFHGVTTGRFNVTDENRSNVPREDKPHGSFGYPSDLLTEFTDMPMLDLHRNPIVESLSPAVRRAAYTLEPPSELNQEPEPEPIDPDLQEFISDVDYVFMEMSNLLARKRDSYGPSNLLDDGMLGITARMGDKLGRIRRMAKKGIDTAADGESLDDAFRDIIGYATLALIHRRKGEI